MIKAKRMALSAERRAQRAKRNAHSVQRRDRRLRTADRRLKIANSKVTFRSHSSRHWSSVLGYTHFAQSAESREQSRRKSVGYRVYAPSALLWIVRCQRSVFSVEQKKGVGCIRFAPCALRLVKEAVLSSKDEETSDTARQKD